MIVSKDEALENAITSSVRNPRHCLYFKDSRKRCAFTLVNVHRIYRLRRIEDAYQKSLDVHEGTHVRACLSTAFKKFLITHSLLSPSKLNPLQRDLLTIYSHEIVPLLEGFAAHVQTNHSVTPPNLKQGITDSLSTHDPTSCQTMSDIDVVVEKITERCKRKPVKRPFDILSTIMNVVFSSANPVEDRISNRFRMIGELSDNEIPAWSKTKEMGRSLIELFERKGHSVTFRNFFTADSLVSTCDFWCYMKKLLKEADICDEIVRDHAFAILSELDDEFVPIIYETDDLDDLENTKIADCLIWRRIKAKKFFGSTTFLRSNVLTRIIKRLRNERVRHLLEGLQSDYSELSGLKHEVFSRCPGIRRCIGKDRCVLETAILNNLRQSSWSVAD